MARNSQPGTPDRSLRYIFPERSRRSLRIAAAGGAALTMVIALAYFAGLKRVSSPGPVSSSHSPIETRCEQCHTVGRGVADVRCERCHDPGGADRFTQQGHVLFGSGNPHKAATAPTVACAACHADHRGRDVPVNRTDDRDCAQCHAFSALKNHPEFAAVRAQISTGAGLSFGHQRHIAEAAKVGRKCEACHEPTADLVGFQPMTFDRHCAACHTKDGAVTGESEAVSREFLTAAGDPAAGREPTQTAAELGRIVLSGMKHKDPWVLYNALRLRRMIDPMGISAESAALRAQIAYLRQQTTGQPLSAVNVADLQQWQSTLEADLKTIDRRLASKAPPSGDDGALNEMRSAVQQVARQLATVDPEAKAIDADAQNTPAPASPAGGDANLARTFDARKAELLGILDAIAARGDTVLAERAAALRQQVESLQPGSGGGQADVAALSDRLRRLDDVLGAVRATDDPQAQFVAGQIGALKNVAQSQINGGLSPDAFEDRRRELLDVLDAIDRAGAPELMARAAVLRQRVLSLQPGSYGDAGLRDERARTVKLLDRIKVEIELANQGDSASASAASGRDAAQLQTTLARLRRQLAALQSGGRPGTADTPADLRKATATLNNMLAPCLKCHVMDGARIAPVAADPKVFERSFFTHKPHVEQAGCAACHKSVETSTKATEVNEPGVANCQSCHQPSKARADCAACHFYHPPSLARLVGAL
jgi:hypothetical protein